MKNIIAITNNGILVVILQFVVVGTEVNAVIADTEGNIKVCSLDSLHIQDALGQFSVGKKRSKKETVEVIPLPKYEQLAIEDFLLK